MSTVRLAKDIYLVGIRRSGVSNQLPGIQNYGTAAALVLRDKGHGGFKIEMGRGALAAGRRLILSRPSCRRKGV